MDVVGGDHAVAVGWRRPALRLPARRRQAIAEHADHHEHEVDGGEGDEGLPDADVGWRTEAGPRQRESTDRIGAAAKAVHQDGGKRRADHGAAAEAHDGHAGRHAAAVGEPLDEGRDRRDVAEAEADAADDAGADPHQPELVDVDAERGQQQAAAPAQRRDECRLARADALQPAAPGGGRDAEQHEEERIHPAEVELAPVAVGGGQRVQRADRFLGEGDGALRAFG